MLSKHKTAFYREILANLATKQKQVLQAIAKEQEAQGITSSAFIKKYNLPSASSVQAAVKGLMEKNLITQTDGVYRVYDYFFADWFGYRILGALMTKNNLRS